MSPANAPALPASPPAAPSVLDLPSIIGKSPHEVEIVTGKPKKLTKITSYLDQMPGEFRESEIKGSKLGLTVYGLMIRFAAGVDVGDAPPAVVAPAATRWKGVFNGIAFKDVSALKMGDDPSLFTSVQVTLAQ
jgi:hypothetical protein